MLKLLNTLLSQYHKGNGEKAQGKQLRSLNTKPLEGDAL